MIAHNKYGKYSLPDGGLHRPACKTVLNGKVYEPKTIKFIRKHGKGKTIIHAGAFFGDFLPALSEVAELVLAFEPNSDNYSHAKETIKLNNLSNVHLENFALSSSNSSAWFKVKDDNGQELGGASHLNNAGDYEVKTRTLDSLAKGADIIHLDVEGHELEALRGAKRILTEDHPILILETVDAATQMFLEKINYKKYKTLHYNTVFKFDG